MRVQINDQWVNVPSSLSEITLLQRIEFQRQHGNELDEILKSILEMEEGIEREEEYTAYLKKKQSITFRFIAGSMLAS